MRQIGKSKWRIESMERQAEKDREAKLAQIEGDKEAKLATEIELEKLKHSFERRHDDLKGQMNLQRAVFKVELDLLLKGRALDVYDRLSVDDAADYEKLKEALLKNFDMTERGFRKKFRYERPEKSETFIQFSSRLRSYPNKWLKMAKIEESYGAVCDFFARDQF